MFFFQAEDGIRDDLVTGVQTCALPICKRVRHAAGVSEEERSASLNVGGMAYSLASKSFVKPRAAQDYPRTSSLFGARRATAIVRAYYRGNRVAIGTGFLSK